MSEQRHDLEARLATMNELDEVLGAMRGMAAARIQQGERAQQAAREYAGRIGAALASLAPPEIAARAAGPPGVAVALCTDRGFVGALNERVLDAARAAGANRLVVVGTRGRALAQERGLSIVDGGGMTAHLGGIGAVADRVAALLARQVGESGEGLTADVVHPRRGATGGVTIERRSLLPVDVAATVLAFAPVTMLPRPQLIAEVGGEYVHARLYEMVAESFAAANAASLEVLQAAHAHLDDMLADLRRAENVLRQDEITAEVLEVITGRMRASNF
jgi:F-type H+-transporting ATPase subunit gamma